MNPYENLILDYPYRKNFDVSDKFYFNDSYTLK